MFVMLCVRRRRHSDRLCSSCVQYVPQLNCLLSCCIRKYTNKKINTLLSPNNTQWNTMNGTATHKLALQTKKLIRKSFIGQAMCTHKRNFFMVFNCSQCYSFKYDLQGNRTKCLTEHKDNKT